MRNILEFLRILILKIVPLNLSLIIGGKPRLRRSLSFSRSSSVIFSRLSSRFLSRPLSLERDL